MWTSHQPFVIPIMVRNFESLVEPNKSVEIQYASQILSNIVKEIEEEENNPIAKSVYEKFTKIDMDSSLKRNEKGIKTFQKLTDAEKQYLQSIDALQPGYDGKPFTLSYPYQDRLRARRHLDD